MSEIAERLERVKQRITVACERAGREPTEVTLVAVTKTHPTSDIIAAFEAGHREFGENRVQEGIAKIDELRALGIRPAWHLLGHLQTNKINAALDRFDILHGVDSVRLAEAISRRAVRPIKAFLEVNVAGEATKQGIDPAQALAAAQAVRVLPNIELVGLMTVAPQVDDPEDVRPVFRRLREFAEALDLPELSMGMTGDFEVAIEEGSTLVRVGRAIFGPREG